MSKSEKRQRHVEDLKKTKTQEDQDYVQSENFKNQVCCGEDSSIICVHRHGCVGKHTCEAVFFNSHVFVPR